VAPERGRGCARADRIGSILVGQGQERIVVYTTFLADGTLFYYLTLAPERDAAAFQDTFRRIGESIRLTEVR